MDDNLGQASFAVLVKAVHFRQCSELITKHALEKWEDGIEIGTKHYNNLRFADDVAFLASSLANKHLACITEPPRNT